jgi:hypothetical protein
MPKKHENRPFGSRRPMRRRLRLLGSSSGTAGLAPVAIFVESVSMDDQRDGTDVRDASFAPCRTRESLAWNRNVTATYKGGGCCWENATGVQRHHFR